MSLISWIRSYASTRKSAQKFSRRMKQRRVPVNRRLLRLELLEDRRVLAALLVTNTDNNGPGSLREAVEFANAFPDADEINFDSGVFATPLTTVLTTGQLTITNPLTINGPGADLLAVSGNHSSRVFQISAGATTYRQASPLEASV